MAGSRIKGITIEIDGNVTKLTKALDQTNKDLKTTQANLRDVNKLLKLDPTNVDLLKQKQKLLDDAVKGVKDRLDKEKEALKQLKEADQTPEVTEQMEKLQRQIADDEAYLKKLKSESKDFGLVAAQQFKNAGGKIKQFGEKVTQVGEKLSKVSGIAAGIGGGLLKLGYDAAKNADDLNTLSKQTGLSTDELQKFRYAADLVDVSVEDITGALKKMKPKMTENNAVFKQLGVNVTNADGSLRDATDVFYDSLTALSQIENETERDQVAMQLFGKSADELAGIIDDGGAALQQYGDEAENLGLILDQDTINSLNDTNDSIDKLKQDVLGTIGAVGADVAEVLQPVLEQLAEGIKKVTEFIRGLTPEQTAMIMKIIGIVAAIGPLLIILGKVISIGGSIVSAIGTVVGALGGPLTIAIMAIIAIGVLLYKNWDKIKEKAAQLRDWLVEKFTAIKEGITKAIETVKTFINERLGVIKKAFTDAGGGIKGVISAAIAAVKQYFKDAFAFIDRLTGGKLTALKEKFTEKFNAIKDKVKEIIEKIKGFFNFEFKLPSIKSPHFAISPPGWTIGDLLKGSIPKLSVEWYRKAYDAPMMFTTPTVMATPQGFKGFGDGNGGEIVYGRDSLLRDISAATITEGQIYNAMVAALATSDMKIVIGSREFGRILRDQGVAV